MKYNDYMNIIKDLEKDSISVFDLSVVLEINSVLQCYDKRIFTEEEKEKIFEIVTNAYLKSDVVHLNNLVWAVINHFDELDNLSVWKLLDYAII